MSATERADDARHPGSLDVLPSSARSVADNYNHLHEQPTIFYALVFYTYLAGHVTSFTLTAAWVYVALRIVHSLVQNTVNRVMARFAIFALSSITGMQQITLRNYVIYATVRAGSNALNGISDFINALSPRQVGQLNTAVWDSNPINCLFL